MMEHREQRQLEEEVRAGTRTRQDPGEAEAVEGCCLLACLFMCSLTRLLAHSLARSLACSLTRLLACSLFVLDRVSLCSPGCLGTHSVDQTGLELRDPPVSASPVLVLEVCATTSQKAFSYLRLPPLW